MAKARKMVALHAHGCLKCKARYEDACATPKVNEYCYQCRTGRQGWTDLIEARKPKACCRESSRPARKEELATYKLVGSAPWFICPVCARTQPFLNPREIP